MTTDSPTIARRGTAVSLQDVSFAYGSKGAGETTVLRGLTATIRPGAVTTVLGPNAAGKTTLLLLMAGLLTTQSGRISLVDELSQTERTIPDLDLSERAGVLAYVAQRPRVDAPFTVREVIELGRYAVGASSTAVMAAMQAVEISPLADRPFHELSVGQQQRVSLARAIAQHDGGRRSGSVLLLDEPMSAMDPKHALQTAGLLKSLATDMGATVIVVVHDLVAASRMADDVLLLTRDGMLAGHGKTAEMLSCERLEAVFEVPFVAVDCPGGPSGTIPVPVARSGTTT